MREAVKKLVGAALGEYSTYLIYGWGPGDGTADSSTLASRFEVRPMDGAAVAGISSSVLKDQSSYAGDGAVTYGCFDGNRVAGLCFYWHGARYRRRNFITLEAGEAKLVQIITDSDMRGQGVARTLIAASSGDMAHRGFRRLFARIWHSNQASISAFEHAGWSRMGLIVEINPLRRPSGWRLYDNFRR